MAFALIVATSHVKEYAKTIVRVLVLALLPQIVAVVATLPVQALPKQADVLPVVQVVQADARKVVLISVARVVVLDVQTLAITIAGILVTGHAKVNPSIYKAVTIVIVHV